MEFDKTRWSCPWNSDQNCTQNSAKGSKWVGGGPGVVGLDVDVCVDVVSIYMSH